MNTLSRIARLLLVLGSISPVYGQQVLVEAESFDAHGGWQLDTQFIEIMGSPYLLAHGLGRPVKDATTTVTFPEIGTYRVIVRTKDWVAQWKAPGNPGRFQLLVNGESLDESFGTHGEQWFWQDGGTVEIKSLKTTVALHDLTGPHGPPSGLDPEKLAGLVVDDMYAEKTDKWTEGTGLKGYVGWGYLYAGADTGATIRFEAKAPRTGRFELRLAYQPHENRGSNVPVSIQTTRQSHSTIVDMQKPPGKSGFISLGQVALTEGERLSVMLTTKNAGGNVHADAVQILRVDD